MAKFHTKIPISFYFERPWSGKFWYMQKTYKTPITKHWVTSPNTQKSNPETQDLHFSKKEVFNSGLVIRGLS
jgi:hypothetical protein